MILVVTLNPALDVTHHVAEADWGGVNRPHDVHARAGGKGLNVARTLRALGQQVTLAGLAGGVTGQALARGLAGTGIRVDLTPIAGETRRTFAVSDLARGQTALFNEPGPAVAEGEYEELVVNYEKALPSARAVVLSGSLPGGVPDDAYAQLIGAARRAAVPAVLDASGVALRLGSAAGPAIVKPNLAELGTATGRDLGSPAEPDVAAAEQAARELSGGTGSVVVVSLGPLGLLAVGPDRDYRGIPPEPVPGNPTGAGDAVVAGLADGLTRGLAWPQMLRHATALGTATAASPVAGEFSPAEYERLAPLIQVMWCA
jgi:tagatose 6-phosphate kinase